MNFKKVYDAIQVIHEETLEAKDEVDDYTYMVIKTLDDTIQKTLPKLYACEGQTPPSDF